MGWCFGDLEFQESLDGRPSSSRLRHFRLGSRAPSCKLRSVRPSQGLILRRRGGVAVCGGRNLRHNAVAHVFFDATQEAGLHQKKKASLLQPWPDTDGLPQHSTHDHLANVWVLSRPVFHAGRARLRGHVSGPRISHETPAAKVIDLFLTCLCF